MNSDTQGNTACEDCKFGLVVRPKLVEDQIKSRGTCIYEDRRQEPWRFEADPGYYYVLCKLYPKPEARMPRDWCGQGKPKEGAGR